MFRVLLTPMLLLAVLIQAVFGCFWRHSHEPAASKGADAVVSAVHDHHHGPGHSHQHGGHVHGSPPPHFHFGGDGGEEHEHEESGSDTYSYLVSRVVSVPVIDFGWIGHTPFDVADEIASSVEHVVICERTDASGHSSWPSGQRLSLLGVWLI